MILFVDDEERQLDSYAIELEMSEKDVQFKKSIDDALQLIEENPDGIDLLILDIMMPPGARFAGQDVGNGLRTGICFYDVVRDKLPDLPVIILTNVSDNDVSERFQKERNCWFRRKLDYLPFEFAEEVERILSKSKKGP